jgi:hypothetical protein
MLTIQTPVTGGGFVAPMERASVATDGDSRTAMDGAKCPLEWVSQSLSEKILLREQTDSFPTNQKAAYEKE